MDFYFPSINPEVSGAGRLRFQMVDNTPADSVTSSFVISLQVNPVEVSGKYTVAGSVTINNTANDISTSAEATKGNWTTLWTKEIRVIHGEQVSVAWTSDITATGTGYYSKRVPAKKGDPGAFSVEIGGHWNNIPDYDEGTFEHVWVVDHAWYRYEQIAYTVKTAIKPGNFVYESDTPEGADLNSKNKKTSAHKDLNRLEAIVLDSNFDAIGIIDTFESFIWTERFAEAGDFEIVTRVGAIPMELCAVGNYLTLYDTNTLMVIEGVGIETDAEDGDSIKIVGRSAESILDRRIVWSRVDLDGSLHDGIKEILMQNVIIPNDPKRKIPFISFKSSVGDYIPSLTIQGQYTGNNLYELIKGLCDYYKIGFRMPFNAQEKLLTFELYNGEDRSFSQNQNPYLIFSREFDNMFNSEYAESSSDYKNVAIVFGKEATSISSDVSAVINSGYFVTVTGDTDAEGAERREILCTDSSSASSDSDKLPTSDIKPAGSESSGETGDDKLPDADYAEKLKMNGEQKLSECKYIKKFTSESDTSGAIVYGKDYYLGDIVEFVSDYGVESRSRITEIIRSHDQNGYHIYPTFLCIDEEHRYESGIVS